MMKSAEPCVCHAILSVYCSLVAGRLDLLYVTFFLVFVTFPCGAFGQVRYFI